MFPWPRFLLGQHFLMLDLKYFSKIQQLAKDTHVGTGHSKRHSLYPKQVKPIVFLNL